MRKIAAILVLWALVCGTTVAEEVWRNYADGNDIKDAVAYGDFVWCTTQGSVVRWNLRDSTYVQYTTFDGLNSLNPDLITVDRTGKVWVTHGDIGSVNYFDGASWKSMDENNSGIPKAHFNAIFPDSKGNIWFGTPGHGIIRYDGTSWETFVPDEILNKTPQDVAVDRNGVKWFATFAGVYTISASGYRSYTKKDGLAGDNVRRIVVSPSGDLWFGTMEGVSRFDGVSWKTFRKADGLVNNRVWDIAFAPDGAVWFATDGGVSRFDGASWKSFTSDTGLITSKSMGIAVDKTGLIWVSHPTEDVGVSCFDGSEWKWYATWNCGIAGNKVFDVESDRDGVVWFATDSGVSRWDGSDWKSWNTGDGLLSYQVGDISVDDRNRIWILYHRDQDVGVSCFDGRTFTHVTGQNGLSSNIVHSMASEGDTLWFCTSKGVCRFDGSTWKKYPENNRLTSSNVSCIAEDNDGAVWFATDRGLTRRNAEGWRTWTTDDGLPHNNVLAVATGTDGRVWMVADSSLVEFDGNEFRSHKPVVEGYENSGKWIKRITVDSRNRIWTNVVPAQNTSLGLTWGCYCFGNSGWQLIPVKSASRGRANSPVFLADEFAVVPADTGLVRFTGGSQSLYRIDRPVLSRLLTMVVDKDNVKWFMDYSTILSYDGRTWKDYLPELEILSKGNHLSFITAKSRVAVDRNNTKWFTSSLGFISFDGKEWKIHDKGNGVDITKLVLTDAWAVDLDNVQWLGAQYKGMISFDGNSWSRYTSEDGLVSDNVTCMMVDRDNVKWFGATEGISSFDGVRWKTYTRADEPFIFGINCMAVDSNNVKWFGTNNGLLRFDGVSWKVYTEADGLASSTVQKLAPGKNGVLWVITFAGISLYDGDSWKAHTIKGYIPFDSSWVVDGNNTIWGNLTSQITPMVLASCTVDSLRIYPEFKDRYIVVDKNNLKWIQGGKYSEFGLFTIDDRPKPAPGETARASIPHHNYPNPFNARTNITFELYSYGRVEVEVYNLLGQKVRTLVSGVLDAGSHHIPWDGTDSGGKKLSSGIYFYRIAAQGRTVGDKMLFLK